MGSCIDNLKRKLNKTAVPYGPWVILAPGSSTGVSPYIYSTGAVSRYRTEENGKVARVQLFIENPTPAAITTLKQIAALPAPINTGKSYGSQTGLTILSTQQISPPVTVNNAALSLLCGASAYSVTTDSNIVIDIAFPLD